MAVRRTNVTVIRNANEVEYFDESYERDGQTRTLTNAVVGDQVFMIARRCYRLGEQGEHVPTNTVVGYNLEFTKDE